MTPRACRGWPPRLRPQWLGEITPFLRQYTSSTQRGGLLLWSGNAQLLQEMFHTLGWVIAIAPHPLDHLALQGTLTPWTHRERAAALTHLADTPTTRGLPLHQALQQPYLTHCRRCNTTIPAEQFIWDRERQHPVEVHYTCPRCGPIAAAADPQDIQNARPTIKPLSYYWILDRIAPEGSPHRERIEPLLETYTPRNQEALARLTMEIEAQYAGSAAEAPLKLALWHCLDRCCSIHAPDAATPPSRTRKPTRFVERNVWLTFEEAVETLPVNGPGTTSPEQAITQQEGIALWPKSIRETIDQLPHPLPPLILAECYPPAPTFWAWSILWTGWLLGPEAARPLLHLLFWHHNDWPRYQKSLSSAWHELREHLPPESILIIIGQWTESNWRLTLTQAAATAGWSPKQLLWHADSGHGTFIWTSSPPHPPSPPPSIPQLASDLLHSWGQPMPEDALIHGLSALLVQHSHLPETDPLLSTIQSDERFLLLEHKGDRYWWLRSPHSPLPPIFERAEEAIYNILLNAPLPISTSEIIATLDHSFPGPVGIPLHLIELSIAAYGEPEGELWHLRADELPSERAQTQQNTLELLHQLASILDMEAHEMSPWTLIWTQAGEPAWGFLLCWTASISLLQEIDRATHDHPPHKCALLPAKRAALFLYRLRHDPLAAAWLEQSAWSFLKVKHLTTLLELPALLQHGLDHALGLTPPLEQGETQLDLWGGA